MPPSVMSYNTPTPCQISIFQQLTNMFENSQLNFAFDYCENINDGRGYTSGIIGFTTGTADAYQVIQCYANQGGVEFNSMIGILQNLAARTSTAPDRMVADVTGLESYCSAWKTAAKNQNFKKCQLDVMKGMYLNPAMALSGAFQLPITKGQIYDTAIQHGVEGLQEIIQLTNNVVPATSINSYEREVSWLDEFLKIRKLLQN